MNEKFEHKKSLGQHFLTSPVVPGWMCDAADIQASDTVIEIGPGTGVLTQELLQRGACVIALETDLRAIAALREKFTDALQRKQLRLHQADVRTFDITELGLKDSSFKVVANIPYYLSGLLFRTYLTHALQPSVLVFLVQKEVAKRICSDFIRGEKESLLSLSVKAYGAPRYVRTVSKGHFTPSPKIDSGIICVQNISRVAFNDVDEELFFEILHLGFGQKRKQLLGNLSKKYDKSALIHIFSTLQIPLHIRAEDLDLKTWLILVKNLQST